MKTFLSEKGFSLLEVMIAFAIIVVVVFVTVIAESGSLNSSTRNKKVIIATNLARNLINEQELKYEGLSFERLQKQESQNFQPPYGEYKWTIEYEEVDFAPLTDLLLRQASKENEKSGGDTGNTSTVLRIFKEYLEKSVRRMKVTVEWPEGTGTGSQTFTQLIVNYDNEINLTI